MMIADEADRVAEIVGPVRHYSQPRICKTCGKEFLARPADVKRGRGVYCQRRCHSLASCETRRRKFAESLSDRFWSFVDKRGSDECWIWMGRKHKTGYGKITIARKVHGAHRVSLKLSTGQDGGDLFALHSCDNPPCVNPAHLRWGTAADNAADMFSRGRQRGGPNSPSNANRKVEDQTS